MGKGGSGRLQPGRWEKLLLTTSAQSHGAGREVGACRDAGEPATLAIRISKGELTERSKCYLLWPLGSLASASFLRSCSPWVLLFGKLSLWATQGGDFRKHYHTFKGISAGADWRVAIHDAFSLYTQHHSAGPFVILCQSYFHLLCFLLWAWLFPCTYSLYIYSTTIPECLL